VKIAAWPPLVKLMAQLEAMGERDRSALLLAGLALAGAAEWFLVWPMHHQRGNIVEAARAEAQGVSDTARQAEQARTQARSALDSRTQALDQELARLGVAQSSGQQISALLARALRPQAVQVVALRELGVEEIETPPAATATAGVVADAATAAPVAAPLLYRHRFELRLAGDVPALLAALAALEQEVRPLRPERVRMVSADGHTVQLTLALVALGTDRVWLSL
jgi:hypothetical protein